MCEVKLSARGRRAAAETFVVCHYPAAMRYKAAYVRVGVKDELNGPTHVFSITTSVTAKECKDNGS